MRALIRPMGGAEKKFFLACVAVSAAVHVLVAAPLVSWRPSGRVEKTAALGERFARAVNAVTDLDSRQRARLDGALGRLDASRWSLAELPESLQWAGAQFGVAVRDSDVVRALDAERSREGRWDVRVWLDWGEGRDALDLLAVAYLAGEATLKSDFGSHRLWIHLEGPDGSGRVAFETMDCRLYRAGKLSAADLLHRSSWAEP